MIEKGVRILSCPVAQGIMEKITFDRCLTISLLELAVEVATASAQAAQQYGYFVLSAVIGMGLV